MCGTRRRPRPPAPWPWPGSWSTGTWRQVRLPRCAASGLVRRTGRAVPTQLQLHHEVHGWVPEHVHQVEIDERARGRRAEGPVAPVVDLHVTAAEERQIAALGAGLGDLHETPATEHPVGRP